MMVLSYSAVTSYFIFLCIQYVRKYVALNVRTTHIKSYILNCIVIDSQVTYKLVGIHRGHQLHKSGSALCVHH